MTTDPTTDPTPSSEERLLRVAGSVIAFLLWWTVCIMAGFFVGLAQAIGQTLWLGEHFDLNARVFLFFYNMLWAFGIALGVPALAVCVVLGPIIAALALVVSRIHRSIVGIVGSAAIGFGMLTGTLFVLIAVMTQMRASLALYLVVALYVAAGATVAALATRALLALPSLVPR